MDARIETGSGSGGGRQGVRFVLFLVVLLAQVFGLAGTLAWPEGWLFVGVMGASVAAVTFGVLQRSPELAEERRGAAAAAKPWDRALVPWVVGLPFVGVSLAALGRRLGWPAPFPAWSAWPAAVGEGGVRLPLL